MFKQWGFPLNSSGFFHIFFRFYPYIMLISCVLLLATLVIYSAIVPKLLNHYTRLMRHYVVAIMMAFSCMSINHLMKGLTRNPGPCKLLGKRNLYTRDYIEKVKGSGRMLTLKMDYFNFQDMQTNTSLCHHFSSCLQ